MKCAKCNGEWVSPQGKELEKCPFCNEFVQMLSTEALSDNVLMELVAEHGKNILLKSNLLSLVTDKVQDLSPQLFKRIRLAVNEKIPQKLFELKTSDVRARELKINAISATLANDYSMKTEVAYEIVNLFSMALGFESVQTTDHIDSNVKTSSDSQANNVNKRCVTYLKSASVKNFSHVDNDDSSLFFISGGLYAMKINGGSRKIIAPDLHGLWLANERVFGLGGKAEYVIYSLNKDGTNKIEIISDSDLLPAIVANEKIYFTTKGWSQEQKGTIDTLCSVNFDGRNKQKICDLSWGKEFCIQEDMIYYKNGGALFSVELDGSNVKKLEESPVGNFVVTDESIYYTYHSGIAEGSYLRIMNMDGSERTNIHFLGSDNGSIEKMAVTSDRIIYLQKENGKDKEGYILKSICHDGSNDCVLCEEKTRVFEIIEDRIFYHEYQATDRHYRRGKCYSISTDGKDKYLVGTEVRPYSKPINGKIYFLENGKNYSMNKDGSGKRCLE